MNTFLYRLKKKTKQFFSWVGTWKFFRYKWWIRQSIIQAIAGAISFAITGKPPYTDMILICAYFLIDQIIRQVRRYFSDKMLIKSKMNAKVFLVVRPVKYVFPLKVGIVNEKTGENARSVYFWKLKPIDSVFCKL